MIFFPKRLSEAYEKIKKLHPGTARVDLSDDDGSLEKLIRGIVSMKREEAENSAVTLPLSKVCAIAGYFPANTYKVDRTNLGIILGLRQTKAITDSFINTWQDYYNDPINIDRLRILLTKAADKQADSKVKYRDIMSLLSGKPVEEELVLFAQKFSKTINETLTDMGLRKESKLQARATIALFYYCPMQTFIKLGEDRLLDVIKTMTNNQVARFFSHFLEVAAAKDLESFTKLARYIEATFGNPSERKIQNFWDILTDRDRQKFSSWLSKLVISEFFEGERAEFWKGYIDYLVDDPFPDRENKRLILNFGSVVVVEFQEVGNAAFLLNPDVYKKGLEFLVKRRVDHTTFKRKLLDFHLYIDRIIHSSGWQYKTQTTMRAFIRRNEVKSRWQ